MTGRGGADRDPIPTDRLGPCPVCTGDLDALLRIWDRDPPMRWFVWDGEVVSKERAEAAVLKDSEDFAKHGFGLWTVEEGECLIEFCGLRHLDNAPGVEVLCGIAPAHWDRGLATEAAAPMLRYGLEEAGLDRILGIADKENAASRSVLEKIGMTLDAGPYTKAA